jgi:hypothetical protein
MSVSCHHDIACPQVADGEPNGTQCLANETLSQYDMDRQAVSIQGWDHWLLDPPGITVRPR